MIFLKKKKKEGEVIVERRITLYFWVPAARTSGGLVPSSFCSHQRPSCEVDKRWSWRTLFYALLVFWFKL